jgi:hypothetical protein
MLREVGGYACHLDRSAALGCPCAEVMDRQEVMLPAPHEAERSEPSKVCPARLSRLRPVSECLRSLRFVPRLSPRNFSRDDSGLSIRVPFLLANVLVLALLAACGNGDDNVEAVDPVPDATETEEPWPPPTPTPEPADEIDVESLAEEAGCDITPATAVTDPWLTEVSPVWIRFDEFSVARSGSGPFQVHNATWHTGQDRVVWHVPSDGQIDNSLEITGHSLDGDEVLPPTTVDLTYQVPGGEIAFANVEFPEEGCWQVSIGDVEAVAYVLPEEQRPDVRAAIEYREQVTPYEIPADCDAAELSGPSTHQGLFASFAIPESDPLAVSTGGIFFAGQNQMFVVTGDQDLIVSGESVDNPAMTPRADTQLASGGLLPLMEVTLDFPVSGCWNIEFEAEGQTVGATFYVYPEECRREPGEELPDDCIVPE